MGRGNRGKTISQEQKDSISKAQKGKILSDDTKNKIREAKLGKKLKVINVKCPHCLKEGGSNVMKRWHFNNCRENN